MGPTQNSRRFPINNANVMDKIKYAQDHVKFMEQCIDGRTCGITSDLKVMLTTQAHRSRNGEDPLRSFPIYCETNANFFQSITENKTI